MSKHVKPTKNSADQLEAIADRAYAVIAEVFPVCAVCDEFYFFPQVVSKRHDWSVWDDFSVAQVASVADSLLGFEQELLSLDDVAKDDADAIDCQLLHRALRTLREQLIEVSPQSTQPTFHLTVLAAGLAEALVEDGQKAWVSRVAGVPDFLQQAADCLDGVPELFLRLGFEMLADLQGWIGQLRADGLDVGELLVALQGFHAAMKQVEVTESYCLSAELLERLVVEHVGCDLAIDNLWSLLNDELQEMEELLKTEASRLLPGFSWVKAEQHIPFVAATGDDLHLLYRRELVKMEAHCRQHGLVPESLSAAATLEVAAVPQSLTSIRASDAYSALPGYPPRGGTFFVMEQRRNGDGRLGRTLEYRMTAAHEAWPGHHLLDSCRWNLDRPLRRPLESPLFYEGWACLAEELMARTGYFDDPWDRFLLAKRRVERAARGLVDLGLQSGRMTSDQAVELLVRVGYRYEAARSVIPKYLLRPGYQVCYTFGLKHGLKLLDQYGRDNVGQFSQTILQEGEIGFEPLARIIAASCKFN
jgi:uncharacterized protein (DUF885 family)